jgi:hypothetical protein
MQCKESISAPARSGAWLDLVAVATEANALGTIRSTVSTVDQELRFSTNIGAALAWPQAYFTPVYEFSDGDRVSDAIGAGTSFRVSVTASSELHARTLAILAYLGDGEHSMTYEENAAHRWRTPERVAIAYSERPGVIIVDHVARTVALITTSDDPTAPFEAARLIREVFTKGLERSGWFVMHAGAVELHGRGIVICGPKYAGKTTLVCALLESAGAHFISNDRVNISAEADGYHVLAWPMSTRIGLGTCLASDALRPCLRGGTFAYPQTGWNPRVGLSDGEAKSLARASPTLKLELITQELAAAFDTSATAGAGVACVVLPRWRPDGPSAEIYRPASDATVVQRLTGQLLTPRDSDYPDWLELRSIDEGELATQGRAMVRNIARRVPIVELSFADAAAATEALSAAMPRL